MKKPGYKTTEFWLTLAANTVGALLVSGAWAPGSVLMQALGVGAMVLASLGYTMQRGSVKKAEAESELTAALANKSPAERARILELL